MFLPHLPVSEAGGGLCLQVALLYCESGWGWEESCCRRCTEGERPAARNNLSEHHGERHTSNSAGKKKNNVRRSPGLLVFEPHLSVCGCRRYSSNLRTVRCDLRPLKVFGTVPGWEPLPPLPSPASTPPDLRQEKKNPNRLISHINIYRRMELLQGHRPTLWHTLKILWRYSDILWFTLIYWDTQRDNSWYLGPLGSWQWQFHLLGIGQYCSLRHNTLRERERESEHWSSLIFLC